MQQQQHGTVARNCCSRNCCRNRCSATDSSTLLVCTIQRSSPTSAAASPAALLERPRHLLRQLPLRLVRHDVHPSVPPLPPTHPPVEWLVTSEPRYFVFSSNENRCLFSLRFSKPSLFFFSFARSKAKARQTGCGTAVNPCFA